jgi:hypothetical protein
VPSSTRFASYRRCNNTSRKLTLLFRSGPARDRLEKDIPFEGYEVFWPDGQRLLGLGRHLNGAPERLVERCVPLPHRKADLTRLPGHRVRRFCLERVGRLYFLDGTPTTIRFDLDRDEPVCLRWVGLTDLADGERLWFDLAALPIEQVAGTSLCSHSHG